MKQKIKKSVSAMVILGALLIVVILIGVITFNNDLLFGEKELSGDENIVQNNENLSGDNTSDEVYKELDGIKRIGDIEISNMRIELVGKNRCKVTAKVKNTSDKDLEPTNVEISVVNEKGEIEEVFGGIITSLIWYEENEFVTYVLADITDAYDINFKEI